LRQTLFPWQSLLLSKALKLQQEFEDQKNELVVSNLEKRVKELENSLAEKDPKVKIAETKLTEAELRITDQATLICDQDKELKIVHSKLKEVTDHYEDEVRILRNKVEVEAKESSKLSKSLMLLRETCSSFVVRSSTRLRKIFNSVGAVSGEKNYSTEDIPKALDFVEKEISEVGEVIEGHGDFCALVASRGTAAAFMKAGCNHAKAVNRPNFRLAPADLIDIQTESRSIGNRFITQI
jgi:chromosome segregation ATPase